MDFEKFAIAAANLGLGLILVLYWIVWDRPHQQKREDAARREYIDSINKIVADKEKACADESQKDREHTLELARLQGEVHKQVVGEIKIGIDAIGQKTVGSAERVAKLEDTQRQFIAAVEKISDRHRNT
jgi:tRNA uridine 5-carbamoylmethylation protein Kti12